MNIKKLKTKHLMALALTLFMVVPMLFAAVPFAKATQVGGPVIISIVPTGQSGAAAGSTTNIGVQMVGTTLSVDVRIDDYSNINIGGTNNGIAGASYVVNWNPAVLNMTSYADGSWLPSQSNPGDLVNLVPEGQLTIGQIAFNTGNAMATADSPTGSVSATLTFNVTSTGTTALTLSPQRGVSLISAPEVGFSSNQAVTGTLTANAQYNPLTTISLYQQGTSSNTVQFAPGVDPIGQTFTMNIFINNPLAVNIWAWNLGVTWNPAAIQLTNIVEGSYLNQTGNTIFVPGYVNNVTGTIPQGISDVYLSDMTTNAASGILANLTFTVINYQNSNINLVQGTTKLGTLDNLTGTTATEILPAPILNNATYISPGVPPAVSPQAVIANPDVTPVTGYSNGYTIPTIFSNGTQIDLTAALSVNGQDALVNPAQPAVPITTYTWTVTQGSSSLLTITPSLSAEQISIIPSVTTITTFTIQLVVSTAATTDTSYNPVSTAVTLSFTVQPAFQPFNNNGAQIDVFIVNPNPTNTTYPNESPTGVNTNEANAPSDAFGPQEQMNLEASVTYNGASVANKEVTFQITNSTGGVIATLTALTNENGIATQSYRLPWVDGTYLNNDTNEFGYWNVYAFTEVQQTNVNDTMPFYFGDIVGVTSVTVTPTQVPRSTETTPSTAKVTIGLQGISAQAQNYWITFTVVDSGNVPVATGLISGQIASAVYAGTGIDGTQGTFTVTPSTTSTSATFLIPSYAFVGTATVYVNVYNQDPLVPADQAVAFCPQAQQTFAIEIPSS